ncbi:MAG: hypothetical protein AB8F95_16760 [Bacteroidia bacterium]
MRSCIIFGLTLVLITLPSCNAAGDRCIGAYNLDQEHEELLADTGWLEYVENNVCDIEYVPLIPTEQLNTKIYGRANCSTGNILIATTEISGAYPRPIDMSEILITIVHEAAHQEDECKPRETEAVKMEQAFSLDLCLCLRNQTCNLPGISDNTTFSCE